MILEDIKKIDKCIKDGLIFYEIWLRNNMNYLVPVDCMSTNEHKNVISQWLNINKSK